MCFLRHPLLVLAHRGDTLLHRQRIGAEPRSKLGAQVAMLRPIVSGGGIKKGCHFVVIPRLKQPKNNPNNDSLHLANYLILNNSVVETAGIEPTVNLDFLGILTVLLAKCRQSARNGRCRPKADAILMDHRVGKSTQEVAL